MLMADGEAGAEIGCGDTIHDQRTPSASPTRVPASRAAGAPQAAEQTAVRATDIVIECKKFMKKLCLTAV
jgi:hypothetical protein